MTGRHEFKYLVPNELIGRIRSDLRPYVNVDKFVGKDSGQYTVRSIYYDTPGLDCYDDKMDGLKVRKKFRIRGYDKPDKDSLVFLEIKRKYEDFISKNRAPLHQEDLAALLASPDPAKHILSIRRSDKDRADALRFFYHYYRKGLRPAVLVVYEREAFFCKFDNTLRLTFDKNLRGALFPSLDMLYVEGCLKPAMSRHFVFEVKFFRGTLPKWMRSIIERYELRRMPLSKYLICIDAHAAPGKRSRMKSSVFSDVSVAA